MDEGRHSDDGKQNGKENDGRENAAAGMSNKGSKWNKNRN